MEEVAKRVEESELQVTNITNSHVTIIQEQHNYQSDGALEETHKHKAKPVNDVRKPKSNLEDTNKYNTIKKCVKNENICILLCYGLPGSGKSEIIRKLAKEFPFETEQPKLFVKWHIQCKDSGHEVKQKLKDLLLQLRSASLLRETDEVYQEMAKSVAEGKGSILVENLMKCEVPVLLIIEDPPNGKEHSECVKLLQDILRCVNEKHEGLKDADCGDGLVKSPKFHVYITSRIQSCILYDDEMDDMDCFKREFVSGFSNEEALKYLGVYQDKNNVEVQSAIKIFERFSGSPLGLHVAKNYCRRNKKSYTKYLQDIVKREKEIHQQERKQHQSIDKNAEHLFQALTIPFQPSDEKDSYALLRWKVLCCLCCLHYDRIPIFLITRTVQVLKEKSCCTSSETSVENIIMNLEDYNMGTRTGEDEMTLHEVVLNAFRLNAHTVVVEKDFLPLNEMLEILTSLITKDLRQKKNRERMAQLLRHLEIILQNIEKEKKFFDRNCGFQKILVCLLNETTAAILSTEQPVLIDKREKYFREALCIIWKDDLISLLEDKKSNEKLICIAKELVKKSFDLGTTAVEERENFFRDYATKLNLSFNEDELKFLQAKCKHPKEFDALRKAVEFCEEIQEKKDLIKKLRSEGLFLTELKQSAVFYAERVASILHNWSRVVLHANQDKAEREFIKYKQMSSLSHYICVECRSSHKVSLLLEKLTTRTMLQIQLKKKKVPAELTQAMKDCQSAIEDQKGSVGMFEDGVLRELHDASNPITRNFLTRILIRIYSRLMATRGNDPQFCAEGDKTCQSLFQLAEDNVGIISNAAMGLIYCAKYHASKKDFIAAKTCFKTYFALTDTEGGKPSFNVRCWGVYNYARIINYSSSDGDREVAIKKCEEILEACEDAMSAELNKLVRRELAALQNLDAA